MVLGLVFKTDVNSDHWAFLHPQAYRIHAFCFIFSLGHLVSSLISKIQKHILITPYNNTIHF